MALLRKVGEQISDEYHVVVLHGEIRHGVHGRESSFHTEVNRRPTLFAESGSPDDSLVAIPLAEVLFVYKSATHQGGQGVGSFVMEGRSSNILDLPQGMAIMAQKDAQVISRGAKDSQQWYRVLNRSQAMEAPVNFRDKELGISLPESGATERPSDDLLYLITHPWLVLMFAHMTPPATKELQRQHKGKYYQHGLRDFVERLKSRRMAKPSPDDQERILERQAGVIDEFLGEHSPLDPRTPQWIRLLIRDLLVAATLPPGYIERVSVAGVLKSNKEFNNFIWALWRLRENAGVSERVRINRFSPFFDSDK